jgi:hypothetical protein
VFHVARFVFDVSSRSEKLTAVKGHVAAVQDMLKAAREEEIAEQEEKARLEKERMEAAKAEGESFKKVVFRVPSLSW